MAEKIIGRHSEKALLEKYYNSGKAEFIAMYGRRRIGKTFLIREYFRNQFSFDMTGVLEGNKNEQMTAFHMALKTYGYKGRKNNSWRKNSKMANDASYSSTNYLVSIHLGQVLFMPWDISGTVGQTGNPKSCSSFVVQLRHGWFAIS